MNTREFSNQFDVLYNDIMSNAAPGVNEYEKSVFLTKAQEEIVKNYFEPSGNKYGKGLDDSPKRQIDFSWLIKTGQGAQSARPPMVFDSRSKVYDLPDDLFLIINEAVDTSAGTRQVIPISYSEYTRLTSRPYRGPVKYQAWRLTTTSVNKTSVELIINNNETITNYRIRYIRRPAPIITSDLTEYGNLTINGIGTISECELNPIIHQEILQRAVELAKVAYEGDLRASIETGQRSE